MKPMRAGRLRHWFYIERLTTTQDSDGAHVEDWVPVFPVGNPMPGEFLPLSGRELEAAAATQSKTTARIRLRYREGILPTDRARSANLGVFNIEAVQVDNQTGARWITLECSSGLTRGN